ncbi:MAG TPA: hypothetical protein GXX42_15775 [Petrimonas sp.]|uniref:hypothetical protein n=1 Tax=Petrimonas sp. TaxID=2023866 RepID=UPI0017704766|nr:hypothetical protein [Petrimonas sp.]
MLEVVVAIVIITVALLAIASMFVQATHSGISAEEYAAAAYVAQKTLEKLKAGRMPESTEYTVKRNNRDYKVIWSKTPDTVHAYAKGKLYKASVAVEWQNKGRTNSLELHTNLLEEIPQYPGI